MHNVFIWFIEKYNRHRISIHAAQVAFFIMISFFPFMMFFITLLKHSPISETVLVAAIQELIPGSLSSLVTSWLEESYAASGTILSVTVISALWASSKGFSSIAYELEDIYDDSGEHRSYLSRRLHSILDTILFTVMIIVSLTLLVYGNQLVQVINHYIPFMQNMTLMLFLLRSALSLFLFVIYFTFIYYFIPKRHCTIRAEIPGAILAAFLWIAFSYLYSFYVDTWGSFSSIYGSLTSIVLLMLWLYFCITFIFLGALLNKYLQTQGKLHLLMDLKKLPEIVHSFLRNKI